MPRSRARCVQRACPYVRCRNPERRRTLNVATFVFPGQGEDNAFGSFPSHWKRLFEDSPLSDITPHVLRHSFASIANDLGFTEVTIAALVGHAKGSVTSKYIHTLDTALIMAADTISGYIEGLLDGIGVQANSLRKSRAGPVPEESFGR
jgi:site-specific recombinase XerD